MHTQLLNFVDFIDFYHSAQCLHIDYFVRECLMTALRCSDGVFGKYLRLFVCVLKTCILNSECCTCVATAGGQSSVTAATKA